MARVHAVGRRVGYCRDWAPPSAQRLRVGDLDIDLGNQRACFKGVPLGCTKTEFELLATLARYPGQVLTYAFLTKHIWGYANVEGADLVKTHLSVIRRRLGDAGAHDGLIRTVHGVGYALTPV